MAVRQFEEGWGEWVSGRGGKIISDFGFLISDLRLAKDSSGIQGFMSRELWHR